MQSGTLHKNPINPISAKQSPAWLMLLAVLAFIAPACGGQRIVTQVLAYRPTPGPALSSNPQPTLLYKPLVDAPIRPVYKLEPTITPPDDFSVVKVQPAGSARPVAPTPQPLPPTMFIDGVSHARQARNLSCESRAAASLAGYHGFAIEEMAFFAALPKSDNPASGFVGDVDAPAGSLPPQGYGVYAGPVAATLRQFGLCGQAHHELGLVGLQAELAARRPVIVWATYAMRPSPRRDYLAADGSPAYAIPFQHVYLAIGYDESGVTLIDVWDGQEKHFSYAAFDESWQAFERMAVTVCASHPLLTASTPPVKP